MKISNAPKILTIVSFWMLLSGFDWAGEDMLLGRCFQIARMAELAKTDRYFNNSDIRLFMIASTKQAADEHELGAAEFSETCNRLMDEKSAKLEGMTVILNGLANMSLWQLLLILSTIGMLVHVLTSSRSKGWKKAVWFLVVAWLWVVGYALFMIFATKKQQVE